MYPFTYDNRYVEQHLCELRAQAERERLVRRADRARPRPRPRHWRRWVSALLSTARTPRTRSGEMLPQEQRRAVQGLRGFVKQADERLEDVGHVGGDVEDHIDAGGVGALGQPRGVIEQHFVGPDL